MNLGKLERWSTLIMALCVLGLLAACGGTATPTTVPMPATVAPTAVATNSPATMTRTVATASRAAATPPTISATATVTRATTTRTVTGSPSAVARVPTVGTPQTPPRAVVPSPTVPAPTLTVPAPSLSATVAGPHAPRTVSAANPMRLYVAGDSFAEWLGADLTTFGQRSGVVSTSTDGKISSGLANPAFFDWPARLHQTLAATPPDVVVIILGANDLHGISTSAGYFEPGEPGWITGYGQLQGEIMDIVGSYGAQLYWLGQPPMRDPYQNAAAQAVNIAAQAQISTRPWVHYVDSWTLLSDPAGNYTNAIVDVTGRSVIVRQADGLHLSREGTTWLATATYSQIRRDWHLP